MLPLAPSAALLVTLRFLHSPCASPTELERHWPGHLAVAAILDHRRFPADLIADDRRLQLAGATDDRSATRKRKASGWDRTVGTDDRQQRRGVRKAPGLHRYAQAQPAAATSTHRTGVAL
jgi:hypothetical protein